VRTNAEVFSSFTIPQNLWATPTGHTSSPAPHTEVVLSPRATRFPRLVGRLLGGTADQTPTSQVSIGGSCRSDSMDCALEARRLRDELWPTYTLQEGGISLQMIGSPGDGCRHAASLNGDVVPSTLWRSFVFATRLVISRGGGAHNKGRVLSLPRKEGERWWKQL